MRLIHRPFCPHSRFARLVLGERGVEPELIEEKPWERGEEFLRLNPAGTTPVLVEETGLVVPGAVIIAEYMAEMDLAEGREKPLLGATRERRVEVRRLMDWFNGKFFEEVSGPLVAEKIDKRFMPADLGGGAPDAAAIRAARGNIRYHLRYVGWLAARNDWLAGAMMSYADLAAAAHVSVVDYLGDVPWTDDEAAKDWYARVKSRPSFRPFLQERIAGMPPSPHYSDLDF